MNVASLFLVPTAIWGSTWLAIKFQLGVVPPGVSVAYRFAVAALLVGAVVRGHGSLARVPAPGARVVRRAGRARCSGSTTWRSTRPSCTSPSGPRRGRVLDHRVHDAGPGARWRSARGSRRARCSARVLGVAGIALMFLPELSLAGARRRGQPSASRGRSSSTVIAAIGNLVSMRMHRDHLPVLPGHGVGHGLRRAAGRGRRDPARRGVDVRSAPALRGVARLPRACSGASSRSSPTSRCSRRPGRRTASFVGVATPVIAMLLSTAFEGYRWTAMGGRGRRARRPRQRHRAWRTGRREPRRRRGRSPR